MDIQITDSMKPSVLALFQKRAKETLGEIQGWQEYLKALEQEYGEYITELGVNDKPARIAYLGSMSFETKKNILWAKDQIQKSQDEYYHYVMLIAQLRDTPIELN
jgi:hypothetical protein